MRTDAGSYLEKSYIPNSGSLATCLMMGILCAPASTVAIDNYRDYSLENLGSHFEEKMYRIPASTWSSVEQSAQSIETSPATTEINVTESLNVLRNLAFLTVDEAVDIEIEEYFASKPIRTRTILVNPRLQQG